MNIAFYAPMKPPTHTIPSGDRRMARLLMQAWTIAGHSVELASAFRSYDQGKILERQKRLSMLGDRLANRLVRRYKSRPVEERPEVWFTYHLYHKAPDWLGPRVADALSIPYILAEASFAPKQAGGPWDRGHSSVQNSIIRADMVFGFNPDDQDCVSPLLKPGTLHMMLPPFMDTNGYDPARAKGRQSLAKKFNIDSSAPWLLTAAMMRNDQKFQSYDTLARALEYIKDRPWNLMVAGTGPAEGAVKELFKPFKNRVTWLGMQDEEALKDLYAAADIFVWPAIKEAYGMVFLEAQCSGLPVVAGNSSGVSSIIHHGQTGVLTPQGDALAFAKAIASLLGAPSQRKKMSAQARSKMLAMHGLEATAKVLHQNLLHLLKRRAA